MPIFHTSVEARRYVSEMALQGLKCTIKTSVFGDYVVECTFNAPEMGMRPEPVPAPKKFIPNRLLVEHAKPVLNLPQLYDYQEDAVAQALAEKHIIIEIPTGRGKTNIGLAIVDKLQAPALIIVPTILLLEQWTRKIAEYGGKSTTVSGNGVAFSPLTVITYASALRYLDEIKKYRVVIFDEVHHLFAPEYRKIVQALIEDHVPYLIGLTATVREFGEEKQLQDRLFPNRFVRTMAEFQKGQTAVSIDVIEQGVDMTEEEWEKYEEYTDTIRNALKRFGDLSGVQRAMSSQIPDIRRIAMGAMSAIAKRKQLLSEMTPKLEESVKIINRTSGQFIVFAESIASAEYIHNSLLKLGVPSLLVHSNMKIDRLERERIMNALKTGKARVLVGVISISEGIDLPDLNQAIIISPSVAGRRQYVQRLGRILRYRPGKQARLWVLYAKGTIEEKNLQKIRDIIGE